ncbi:hypothetical protein T4D_9044 [Trichinella pseudospiralis]|uniref:Uncharacterized protein n=1 Tax=Trichinella pseudospiralis TaxID=6337 RepID=A0A0V1FK28_TRIPS|nr:hypothetical protein T4D_9044 [Trichinella pseudospiralis]
MAGRFVYLTEICVTMATSLTTFNIADAHENTQNTIILSVFLNRIYIKWSCCCFTIFTARVGCVAMVTQLLIAEADAQGQILYVETNSTSKIQNKPYAR